MISVIFYVLSNFDRLPYKSPYIHKCVNQILIPCQQVLILIILTYSEKPLGFFLRTAPNPTFCVPSQFVSWSAQPLEPPSGAYVSALHDKCSPFLCRENLFWLVLVNVLASDALTFQLSYYFVPTAVLKKERSGLRD